MECDRAFDRVIANPNWRGLKLISQSKEEYQCYCPAHDDTHRPSLNIMPGRDGRVVTFCYVGCTFENIARAIGCDPQDFFPRDLRNDEKGITVGELAATRRLPRQWLFDFVGLTEDTTNDGQRAIRIPYRNFDGTRVGDRWRYRLKAKAGSFWDTGMSVMPYGLWLLKSFKDRKRLILVEGETDCYAGWLHGYSFLGIPGAGVVNKAFDPAAVSDFADIYVWQEPGQAAAGFTEKVVAKMRSVGREAKVISSAVVKDPSELNQRFGSDFREEFEKCLAAATAHGDSTAVVPPPKGVANILIPDNLPKRTSFPDGKIPIRDYRDEGNADRLMDRHGQNFRWVDKFGAWMTWTGVEWKEDEHHQVRRWCEDTILAMFSEAAEEKDVLKQVNLIKHASLSRSANAKRNMETLVKDKAGIAICTDQLDNHPHLLNCQNGTVDLRDGTLRPACREDYLTKSCPYNYAPDAKCPTWERTLSSIFPAAPDEQTGNKAVIDYVQKILGLSASGWLAQILPIFHGGGSNGKSTLVATVMAVLGTKYATPAGKNFLTPEKEQHPTVLADLFGRRLVLVNETPAGKKFDTQLVKMLTSIEPIKAHKMCKDEFSFKPTHTAIMCTNHLPRVPEDDDGIWRRIVPVAFKARFWNPDKGETGPEHLMQDKQLADKLLLEAEGILAWIVRGAVAYHREGLSQPPEVSRDVDDYRRSEDSIGQFLAECTEQDREGKVLFSDLYAKYKQWCEENAEPTRFNKAFSDRLRKQGYTVKPGTGHKTTVFGLRFRFVSEGNQSNSHVTCDGDVANRYRASFSDLDD